MTLVDDSISNKLLNKVMKQEAIKGSRRTFFFLSNLWTLGNYLLMNLLIVFDTSNNLGVSPR
jgi:hypothetical protein